MIKYEAAINLLQNALTMSDFPAKESDQLSEKEYAEINQALGVLIIASSEEG